MATATEQDLASHRRDAIDQYPHTRYHLAKEAGMGQIAIDRFMSGERDIQLRNAGKIARVRGLKLTLDSAPDKEIFTVRISDGTPNGCRIAGKFDTLNDALESAKEELQGAVWVVGDEVARAYACDADIDSEEDGK